MSYTIHKVGEFFSSGEIGPAVEIDVVLTDTVAADEAVGLAMAGANAVSPGDTAQPVLSHANLAHLVESDTCFSEYPAHVNGVRVPLAGSPSGDGVQNVYNNGSPPFDHTWPNPQASLSNISPVTAPIGSGETMKVRWCGHISGGGSFQTMAGLIYAIKTDPPLLFEGDPPTFENGCSDMCMAGIRGNAPTDPDYFLASPTQSLKAFGYQNLDYDPPNLICGRNGEPFILMACIAAYTTEVPSYSAGWTEELSSSDGGLGVRVALVLKETDAADFSEYDLTATWAEDVNASAVLLQISEDTPPAVWFNHAVGFH